MFARSTSASSFVGICFTAAITSNTCRRWHGSDRESTHASVENFFLVFVGLHMKKRELLVLGSDLNFPALLRHVPVRNYVSISGMTLSHPTPGSICLNKETIKRNLSCTFCPQISKGDFFNDELVDTSY